MMLLDGMTGQVRLHHILPELWVLEARHCAHRWIVYHQNYSFCLIKLAALPWSAEWTYRHHLHITDSQRPMMLMQPGELHCNKARTPPGEFIVVEVGESLMKKVAWQLGWPHHDLNLRLEDAGNANPAMQRALERFRDALCPTLFAASPGIARCTCPQSIDRHLENLAEIVAAFIQSCAEKALPLTFPNHIAAPVRKAVDYLRSNYHQPYSLDDLANAAGCGRFYLAHLFKQQVGVSPTDFKNRILVAKTCQAIAKSPQAPLELIAEEVGWAGQIQTVEASEKVSLMIRHFQRTLRLTPGQFRSSLRRMSTSERRAYTIGGYAHRAARS